MLGNLLFAAASTTGLVSITSVLASNLMFEFLCALASSGGR